MSFAQSSIPTDASPAPNTELEPQLQYEQLGADVASSITAQDRVSCLCLSDKILAMGTESGSVHVLDYSGNEVRRFKHHRQRVNDLSFDKDEEYLASCSDDKSVSILNLYSDSEVPTRYEYKNPVKTVAIDPNYAHRKTKELVIGGAFDRQVTFSTQGWLGRSEYSLYEGAGVQLVKWSGQLIAWATDRGVWVYDTATHNVIRLITRPHSRETPCSSAPCPNRPSTSDPTHGPASTPVPPPKGGAAARSPSPKEGAGGKASGGLGPKEGLGGQGGKVSLIFGQNKMMYVGWPDCIKIARIFVSEDNVGQAAHGVEVVTELRTPYYVLGVAPFGEDLAVLSYPLDNDASKGAGQQGAPSDPLDLEGASVSCELVVAESGDVSVSLEPTVTDNMPAQLHSRQPVHPTVPVSLGKTPELRIISTRNEQFAVDALPISGAEGYGPMEYSLVPSLPATSSAATSTTLKRDWGLPANAMSRFYASVYAYSPYGTTGSTAPRTGAAPFSASDTSSMMPLPEQGPGQADPCGTSGLSGYAGGLEYMYFVVSPQDILVGRTRSSEDRIDWLLNRRRFEEALMIAESDRSVPQSVHDNVVNGYINDLMTREAFDTAAQLSRRLLKDDAKLWETWVIEFAKKRQLPKLAPLLPTQNPTLRPSTYEMALTSLLPNPEHHEELLELVRSWPNSIYSPPTLVDAVVIRMKRPGGETDPLWTLLAHLYSLQGRPDLSLSIYLQQLSPIVFQFIEQHALVSSLMGRAAPLMEIDESAALALLVKHCDVILPSEVVPSLQEALETASGNPKEVDVWRRRLHGYLAGVFCRDQNLGGEYHDLQVKLIADYAPNKLMEFLTTSQYYPLEAALSVCEEKGMVPEQVFILGRMGNATKALHLIIEKLGDIPQAIDFVNDQRDDELWDYLISWALQSPETTGSLLDHVGGHINPLTLLKRIPKGLPIPKLRNRIRSIIQDYRTQTSLHEGCNAILRSDCNHLIKELYRQSRQSVTSLYCFLPSSGVHAQGQWYSSTDCTTDVASPKAGSALKPIAPGHLPACVVTSILKGTQESSAGPTRVMPLLQNGSPAQQHSGQASKSPTSAMSVPAVPEALLECRDVPTWMGFNLENAATHIKLAKEEVQTSSQLSPPARGAVGHGKQGHGKGEVLAYRADSTHHPLPSLVMR